MNEMVDFTEREKRQLGNIFPENLFSKVVTVIRDAILGAPKFTEKIREVIAEQNLPTRAEFEALKRQIEKQDIQPEPETKPASSSKSKKKGSAKKKLGALSGFADTQNKE